MEVKENSDRVEVSRTMYCESQSINKVHRTCGSSTGPKTGHQTNTKNVYGTCGSSTNIVCQLAASELRC